MNSIHRSLTRLTHRFMSSLSVCTLMMSMCLVLSPCVGSAQPETSELMPQKSATTPEVADTPKSSSSDQAQAVQRLPSAQGLQNNKDEFEQVKEARLNELRYKHLWIAYSLVWLIIFIFIRKTWIRSQAVEQRIIELQSRLNKLE